MAASIAACSSYSPLIWNTSEASAGGAMANVVKRYSNDVPGSDGEKLDRTGKNTPRKPPTQKRRSDVFVMGERLQSLYRWF